MATHKQSPQAGYHRIHHHHHHHLPPAAAEPYELSQDLITRHLEVLENKYGGTQVAKSAATTIQRAYRRYSMQKKFALLTAQIKSERRNSRRIDYRRSVSSSQDNNGLSFPTSAAVTTSYPAPHLYHHVHHHHIGGTAVALDGGCGRMGGQQPLPPPTRHSANCRYSQRGRQLAAAAVAERHRSDAATAADVDPQMTVADSRQISDRQLSAELQIISLDTEDSSSSSSNPALATAGIQSFPLDETCVYSNSGSLKQSSSSSSSPRVLQVHARRDEGGSSPGLTRLPSSSSTSSNGSQAGQQQPRQRKMSAPPPNVPRRTVSRLSSAESGVEGSRQLSEHSEWQSSDIRHVPESRHVSNNVQTTTCFLASSTPSAAVVKKSPSPGYLVSDVVDCRGSGGVGGGGGGTTSHRGNGNVVAPLDQGPVPTVISALPHHKINEHNNNNSGAALNEVVRKRHYRTGLNIFNKKPEKGIAYLIKRGFLENSPQHVARFLITRKGLSKQMIGQYLGNLTYAFNMAVLECFANELEFSGLEVDKALRKFQTHFRMPGEAQKIERLVEVFSERYCQCNPDLVSKLHSADTVFILSFAIILLNTDLHTPSLKADKRMKLEDFVKNLRGIDDRHDVDHEMLVGIYERIRKDEFKTGPDHVSQVIKVQKTIEKNCPDLALPHRRLVCYCRLYEVNDPNKKERQGLHQREVFLFNDILVITKILKRKKNTVTYEFRQSHTLAGLSVTVFENQFYPYGIKISPSQKWESVIKQQQRSNAGRQLPLLILNARNEHDREKFVDDLRESIAEMDEMERLRIDGELEKQRLSVVSSSGGGGSGSGGGSQQPQTTVASSGKAATRSTTCLAAPGGDAAADSVVLRKSAINNSLLDLTDSSGAAAADKMTRRGSVGSLDSGMSVSFQGAGAAGAGAANGAGQAGHQGHCYHHHYHHHYMTAHHRQPPPPHQPHRDGDNAGNSSRHLNRQFR